MDAAAKAVNTPSHLIMTAALRKALGTPRDKAPVLWGSVAPDVPLYVLSIAVLIWLCLVRGWSGGQAFGLMYGTLYFDDPIWIALHSVLHAPAVQAAGLGVAWALRRQRPRAAIWLAWFFAACALHTLVDVATHHDDGPLIFFPFDWTTRVRSPVSYWDPAHYGRQFAVFELGLDLVLLAYVGAGTMRRWLSGTRGG